MEWRSIPYKVTSMTTPDQTDTVGDVLRVWRKRRRFSQMELAGEADISARHLSFVENGKSSPSRDMLMRLAEPLAMPLRERNRLLLAAGYAPQYPERPFDDREMTATRQAVQGILAAHEPFPALAVDRHWTLVAANTAIANLLVGVAPRLLEPPVNVLRLSLEADGLAPSILNLAEWRHHLLERLRRDATSSGDARLFKLHDELRAIPVPASSTPPSRTSAIAVPLVLRHPATGLRLSFLSTTTVFGTATDITLSELTLEAFLPADEATRQALLGAGQA